MERKVSQPTNKWKNTCEPSSEKQKNSNAAVVQDTHLLLSASQLK